MTKGEYTATERLRNCHVAGPAYAKCELADGGRCANVGQQRRPGNSHCFGAESWSCVQHMFMVVKTAADKCRRSSCCIVQEVLKNQSRKLDYKLCHQRIRTTASSSLTPSWPATPVLAARTTTTRRKSFIPLHLGCAGASRHSQKHLFCHVQPARLL